jgi:flagellar FliL protein
MPPRKDETITVQLPPKKAEAGNLKSWLPLITAVAVMPVLAFATMKYVLIPQVQASLVAATGQTAATPAKPGVKPAVGTGDRISVPMNKVLVNLAGSMGSRYLLASVTLVGTRLDFEKFVESHKAQLTDLAAGILSAKTMEDLEKPGARNTVRSELLAAFNTALGEGTVQELYLTEFAVQ